MGQEHDLALAAWDQCFSPVVDEGQFFHFEGTMLSNAAFIMAALSFCYFNYMPFLLIEFIFKLAQLDITRLSCSSDMT